MKTFSTQDLAQRVAQELSIPGPQVESVLQRAIEVARKELQRGNRVELAKLLSVSVKLGQPVAARSAAEASLNLPPARLVQMELDEDLRKRIEGAGLYHIILVVPQKNFFTGVMAARLSTARSEVTVAQGVNDAVEQIQKRTPDLVVLEAGLDNAALVTETIKKKKATSLTAVIRIVSEGPDAIKVHGLEATCDETIAEPFELADLVKLAEAELARMAEERNYFEHVMNFKFQTTEELVEKANEVLGTLLSQSGLDEESQAATAVAFREGVDNAARHGNKYNDQRVIDVQYLVDREKVTVAIADEGDGFDTEIYLSRGVSGNPVEAARERTAAGGVGGLGILLMLKCVDKLEYNYAGNKITLSKFIRRTAPAAS
jgi:anti-sigma regulatory factor (Ser/Thr protein kinase)/CheY-like chemotaxis protein/nucleoid DNA-binding protein